MMGKTISINTQYRPHLLVGLSLGIWLYCFLVLVGPFDAAELSVNIRIILMLGYGFLFFCCYALLIPIQNSFYRYTGNWNMGFELGLIALFCLVCLPACFTYYKSSLVNGNYGFGKFSMTVYLPILAILLPAIFLGRYLITRSTKEPKGNPLQESITLFGDNKLDVLKLQMIDLVALEAANNYVAVYYISNGELKKKLLRSSLRKIHQSVPEMIQVHRSYLINLDHFIEWKDAATIGLTQFSVPVSQKYKSTLQNLPLFAPK